MGFLRQCPCPVWIVKEEIKTSSQSIIAAVDVATDYPENERSIREKLNIDVLTAATSLAGVKGCSVKVVSAWSAQFENTLRHSSFLRKSEDSVDTYIKEMESEHKKNFDAFMGVAKKALGEDVYNCIALERVSLKGKPREVLPEYAKQIGANLVVMGTVARVGIPGLIIGNTAESILNRLDQSVLAIKPEGFA